jgi:glucosamine--fructose-6-phosphate aminotransferase (isomerizing)
MIKEILEEPTVINKTLNVEGPVASKIAHELKSKGYEMIYITGSGTSYHAGLASQYALSNLSNLMTSTIPASEFHRWVPTKVPKNVLFMGISQSGESFDVLEAAKAAVERGIKVLAVTNTPESKLAKMAEYCIIPRSGKEKAVPATKTYVTHLMSIFMLSVELATGNLDSEEITRLRKGLHSTSRVLDETLRSLDSQIQDLAAKYREKNILFLLGSGPNYATALEGALKLKETCHIFAEGFATREFLHGPMRLVDERTVVLMIVPPDEISSNLNLCRRLGRFGAPVILISEDTAGTSDLSKFSDETILVRSGLPKIFSPLLYVVPLQLFSYYSSVFRGLNPDIPEKLTKVVK